MGDFQLRINDTNHEIQLPDDQIARLLLVNEDNEVSQGFTDPLYGQGLTDRIRGSTSPGHLVQTEPQCTDTGHSGSGNPGRDIDIIVCRALASNYLNDISPRNVKSYLISLIIVVTA